MQETLFFREWLEKRVLREPYVSAAWDAFMEAERVVPELKRFRVTPQTPPWHAEGPVLVDHIVRILATIFAVVDGVALEEIEEFARHKIFDIEIEELSHVIKEEAGTLLTYALVHDLAKPDTVSFSASSDSKGAKELFISREGQVASTRDIEHYQKLLKAFSVRFPEYSGEQLGAAFYDEYGIQVHNYEHDKKGAQGNKLEAGLKIAKLHHVSSQDTARLQWVVRHHIDVIQFFRDEPKPKKYELLLVKAAKAGFDPQPLFDLLTAATFLDICAGSLQYQEGRFSASVDPVIHMLQSEREHLPMRAEERRGAREQMSRKQRKEALIQAGLAPEHVFNLLDIPHGPERGHVMESIYRLLDDKDTDYDFGRHRTEIREKVLKAKEMLKEGTRD